MFGRPRLAEQAAVLRTALADVVLLQEVASADQADRLANLAGLGHVAFGPTRKSRAGQFGNAVLSRWPLEAPDNRSVEGGWPRSEARAVLSVRVMCQAQPAHALATHFGLLPGEAVLAAQTVLDIARASAGPLIVGGDFNRPAAAAACHRLLSATLVDCASAHGRIPQPTFPSPAPLLRLDYLYARDLLVREIGVVPTTASDHRPLLAHLALPATA